ncbi:uncharacterized protein LOC128676097 [Plodia interpunctella]|uniref:uncharacterized protein LOC128676097 n=1 Tax=Plodia interpunctella TaxID=58824 RepID=UPI002367C7B2|nr:uncharacterized protein LOC128676097 [Plodia interpunctella]
MDSLIKVQINTNKIINKAYTNFKKSPKERLTAGYLETRLAALETQWCMFSENHNNLISKFNIEDLGKYIECDIYEVTEELYFEYKAELKDKLSQIQPVVPTFSESHYSNCKSKDQFQSSVKLPRITIPTFSGSYTEWTSFRDLFMSLVHTNQTLDNVQKLYYLKCHLSGEAEQLLRHFPITSGNYDVCWNLLDDRYNNKRFIANSVLNRFINQGNVSTESASDLKKLLDTSNECINALINLGFQTDTWDMIVIYILCTKLDIETRKMWETKLSETQDSLPTYKQFAVFLQQRFRSLEFLDDKVPKNIASSKVLHATESILCPFCSSNHKLFHCKQFAKQEPHSRRNFVKLKKICFNCFGSNHSVYSCRAPSRCRICHRKHHSLLHVHAINTQASNVPKVHTENSLNIDIVKQNKPCKNVTQHVSSQSHVLLATALVNAKSKAGTCKTLRSIVDPGSQTSFITESAAQLLGLPKEQSKSRVSGLGGDRDSEVTSGYVVNLQIQSLVDPRFNMQVKAHIIKTITTLLPENKIAVQKWSNLSGIRLADPKFNTPNKIDLLLGAEVYGQIIDDGLIRSGPDMPVAQNSKLGWILSGTLLSTDENQRDEIIHTRKSKKKKKTRIIMS